MSRNKSFLFFNDQIKSSQGQTILSHTTSLRDAGSALVATLNPTRRDSEKAHKATNAFLYNFEVMLYA